MKLTAQIPFSLSRVKAILMLVFLACVLTACSSGSPISVSPSVAPWPAKVVAIPFQDLTQIYGQGQTIRSPVSGKIFSSGTVVPGADDFLSGLLVTLLQPGRNVNVVSPMVYQNYRDRYNPQGPAENYQRDLYLSIAKALNAEAVLVGHVYRFRQRQGSSFAVQIPASVAFDVYLLRASDGKVLWSAFMDETQQSISENLFRFELFSERGGRWITAEEMATSALEKILSSLP